MAKLFDPSQFIDAKVNCELLFRERRVYFTFWDNVTGQDIACQVKDGKIMEFVHKDEDAQEVDDPMEQKEITFDQFIAKVKLIVSHWEK